MKIGNGIRIVAMGLVVLVTATAARADYARGQFNNWAANCPLLRAAGANYYSATFQAESSSSDPGLKFDLDGNWSSTTWGAGTSATVNGSIGEAISGGGNLAMSVTAGRYYTFHLAGDYNWAQRAYLVMETEGMPVSISSVSDNAATAHTGAVTVTVALSAAPGAGEKVYLQYTVDGWGTTPPIVEMSVNGVSATATIPAQAVGTVVEYYVFTSTMPSTLFTTDTVYSSPANLDQLGFCMLELNNNGGGNFTYTVTSSTPVSNLGNAWHVPTNAEPMGVYMRTPRHPYAYNAVSLYSGNQAGGDGGTPGNQTGGTVWYRLAGGTWQSTAMVFDSTSGNNKYWRGEISANTFAKAQTVEYVLEITYSDHDATYLGLAAGSSVASGTYATLAEAQARPFDFTYGDDFGTEPGFIWHAGNAVKVSGDTVQLWVKIGYKSDTDQWADQAEVRYAVGTATAANSRQGVRKVPKGARAVDTSLTNVVAMRFDHTEYDDGGNGDAMWWVADVTDAALAASPNAVLRYQIAARRTTAAGGNNLWRLAEWQTDGMNDQVFEYRMQTVGANALTVNGLNADYTTSKFFIDEATNETVHLRVLYSPPVGATDVQLFSNVGRRDFWDADIDENGVPDSIRPPSGDLITADTTNGYYRAWSMTWSAADGAYVWEGDIGRCGAYRLTARYKAADATTWSYYSETGSGIRDHAVVISPRKVLRQSVYEVNALTIKATAATENGRSTFADLIDGADGVDEFGIAYLNQIQANCLWFQPIHTSSEYGLTAGGEPGSPYATKDYFSVSKWFGRDNSKESAMLEFQRFVAACDAGKSDAMPESRIGTINIMLDGVFNHTSWDAVLGEAGEVLGYGASSEPIASRHPGWYANVSDYGAPATWYHGPGGGEHDIACAPDRGDFGKWTDTAELFYGNYAALTRHNPEDNGAHLSEADWYDYSSMSSETEQLWDYMGYYVEYWLEKTGHPGVNTFGEVNENGVVKDDLGIDGLRCDFGQGLPPQFWEYCINRARAHKWNFMFMAESLDGGNVSYRSNRHFDILNESFVFSMVGAGTPADVRNALESRRTMYNGGAILLNLTSHDEIMPFSDPWTTASRYAMVSSVMGLPMCFYGQEQGIVPCTADKAWRTPGDKTSGDRSNGFAWFELNMGKWVPHFKEWNRLLVWDNPPSDEWSRPMAQWYGRVNGARLNSPALRSANQYFLGRKNVGTYDNNKILAVAKYEDDASKRSGKDAVLAFSLFVNVGDHSGMTETYDLLACADQIGLKTDNTHYYNVRNLAASDASAYLWSEPMSGAELAANGITVVMDSDSEGAIYDDGHIVQYLQLEEVTVAPVTHTLTVTAGPNGTVSPLGAVTVEDGASQEFVVTANTLYRIAEVLTNNASVGTSFDNNSTNHSFTWANITTDGTLHATFTPVVTTNSAAAVPKVWLAEYYPEESDFETCATTDTDGDSMAAWQEYLANTDPTKAISALQFATRESPAGGEAVTLDVAVRPDREYRLEFTDQALGQLPSWTPFADSWINTAPYAETHSFTDDFTSATSGSNIPGMRTYRIKVSIP